MWAKSGHLTRTQNVQPRTNLSIRLLTNVTIDSNAFAGTSTLQTLKLIFGRRLFPDISIYILSLGEDSFSGLSNLRELSITNAVINSTGHPLEPLKNLKRFEWAESRMKEVPMEHLASLPHLEELSLRYNAISTLRSNTFVNLKNLRALDLSSNRIQEFEIGCFNGLENLENLNLSYNRFKLLSNEVWNLPKLKVFIVNDCRKIDKKILEDSAYLSNIEIKCNGYKDAREGWGID
uniref:Uncharacterized protein n=1 Tax=Bracon brevicornis TaxID=1563983 RepID=A0A6V7ILQ9_9HYME